MFAEVPVLALDGPSGSGKGTVGQICAQRLGWHFLDSGAIYRALAYVVEQAGISAGHVEAIVEQATRLELEFVPNPPESARIFIGGVNVDDPVRTEETGKLASRLASIAKVRETLLTFQRGFRRPPGLVADGRDMGTVVFPDAQCKIFLTAGAEIRAQRRYNQLKLKGFDVSLSALFEAIQERDARDAQRSASPLVAADDAVTFDTSDMSIEEVVSRVLNLIETTLP